VSILLTSKISIPLLSDLRAELKKYWNQEKSLFLQNFFHSDSKEIFRGVTVPNCHIIAKKYIDLDFNDIQNLLESVVHDERLIALFILELKYKRADQLTKGEIFKFYLKHTKYVNNWDLVDASADKILGNYLLLQPRDILYELVKSPLWWERRIAIISTYQFIKVQKQATDTFKLSEILLHDKHDLIQKATGWMLREVGKRISKETEVEFLNKFYRQMPRTMLRYAIEHFSVNERQKYLKGLV
jgi:3-methyladenine DNA glycosylase AlkD